MTTKDVVLMPQNLSKISFDEDDQWVVNVDKEYTLTGKQAEILKEANEQGYTGIVWFPKFAISIAHIKSIKKHRDGVKYREQLL